MLLQERPVDQLDMESPVLHRLDGVSDLHQLTRGCSRFFLKEVWKIPDDYRAARGIVFRVQHVA